MSDDFLGPCLHGRDPFDRCDACQWLEPHEAEALAKTYKNENERSAGLASLRASVDTLRKENGLLRQALGMASDWIGSDDAIDDYEKWAERYRRETGRTRPGKDVSAAEGSGESEMERRAKWSTWIAGKLKGVKACARAALETTPPAAKPACWRCGGTGTIPEGRVGAGVQCIACGPPAQTEGER